MTHDDASELLAALSLDALDETARHEVEGHVASCARCQRELDELHVVATALGTTPEPLPESLWSRIAERLYEREDHTSAPVLAVDSLVAASTRRRTRRTRGLLVGLSLAAAAAMIGLGVGFAGANAHVSNLQSALARSNESAVTRALHAPGHQLVTLSSSTDAPEATFVLLPSGRGYLVSSSLAALGPTKTYQLWGIVGGSPVSLGLMGRSPSSGTFTMAGVRPSALALTVEPASGATTPASTITAAGAV